MWGSGFNRPAAALAGGWMALAALAGCGGGLVAGRSAAALHEAQENGEISARGGQVAMDHGSEVPPDTSPAATLRLDPFDAPAPTSVEDARRAAELAAGMAGHGGHGGHGEHGDHGGHGDTYRHVDAGRGPAAREGSEGQTPGAGEHHHHDHGSAAPPSPPPTEAAGAHAHGPEKDREKAVALYSCPMHPEVTSPSPGKCPKCGMALAPQVKGEKLP